MWEPFIEERSNHGVNQIGIYAKLLRERRVFLTGEINEESANCIVAQLMTLDSISQDTIKIYINSPGGEVRNGLMIYDTMKLIASPIDVICIGSAASMAAVLLAGGEKGHRYIYEHAKTMIHEPLLSSGVGGSATSIKNISESILQTKDIINSILMKHTGKTKKEIDQATSFDNYMNAEESVKFGLCDEIIKGGTHDTI